jgi:parvulin-like peptidyl-prolyl isomerase
MLVPDENQQGQFQNIHGYRLVIQEMVTDELVRRWAAEREADQDENIQHVMQHITEEINLDELHAQMHQGQMGVTEGDIQAYYDANRDQFGDLTVTQVRDQIRTTLQSRQEDQFVQNYIDGLKEKAAITRDFDLLAVPEPIEQELNDYYRANQAQYLLPARAVVNEIRIPVGDDEAAARQQAEKSLARLRSGETLALVANDVSQSPLIEGGLTVIKGQRDPAYDEVVFNLDEGQYSQVFKAGDAFYIARLQSKESERQQSLDEVRTQVRQAVLAEREAAWFEERANQTLLTINGKRYTVGEFWQEYQELPVTFVTGYQGVEGRQALAERLIERLLLLQDSYDQLLDVENQDELEEMRLDILAQMMEQEEVDDKIEITDEEIRAFYEQHKSVELMEPPQSRVRQIMIRLGQTEDEYQKAWEKANEAYGKLVPGLFQEGADFAEVAREYSEDEATAAQGGEVPGWIGEGPDLMAEIVEHPFHQQVLQLSTGEISRPFEWNGAVYIIQALEQTEPRPLAFEEVKEILREELRLQKHQELEAQLSERLLGQANLTVYNQALQTLVEGQAQTEQP